MLLGMHFCAGAAFADNGIDWDAYPAYYELDEWSIDWTPTHGLRIEAHRVIRVNRPSGISAGHIRIWDTFFQRLKKFDGTVSDTLGEILYSVDENQVRSVSPFSEFRLYSGDAIRAVELEAPKPPYIVEARWEVEIDNPFFWPDWVLGDRLPRRRSVYRVAIPPKEEIRYRQVIPQLVRTSEDRVRRRVTTWELLNWEPEDTTDVMNHAPVPLLYMAPAEFKVGRRKGKTESWDELGRWYWDITSGRLGLKADQIRPMRERIADIVSDRARAAALKDWISDAWRYVAIEIGLGGWQPHASKLVFDNRYGDCKDMVFLYVSMLREIGLEAYPALVRARNPLALDPEFPKDWFDHVIAMTIIDGDTLWADPSDSRYRLGTLPRSCEARWALAVGEFGGTLVRTPCRTSNENRQSVYCEGRLTDEGDLEFTARLRVSGHYAQMFPLHAGISTGGIVAMVLGVAPPAINGSLEHVSVVSPDEITAEMRGMIRGWALAGPQRMVVRPRLSGWTSMDTLAGRADPSYVDFPQIVFDTVVITFPPHWEPEFWPSAEFLSPSAGEFGEGRAFENNRLVIMRHLRWEECRRSDAIRRVGGTLRAAYRGAKNAEWVFRRVEQGGPAVDTVPLSRDGDTGSPASGGGGGR
jgi:hypothetical protein